MFPLTKRLYIKFLTHGFRWVRRRRRIGQRLRVWRLRPSIVQPNKIAQPQWRRTLKRINQ